MKKIDIIVVLFTLHFTLSAQNTHNMEFNLKGNRFDTLHIVAYDSRKQEIVIYPSKQTSTDEWFNEIPDSIWKTNNRYVLGKSDEKNRTYEYICFQDTSRVKNHRDIGSRIGIFPDGNDVKIKADYSGTDTIFDNDIMLIFHNYKVLPNFSSGINAMIKYPDFSTFSQTDNNTNNYKNELASYIAAVKDYPDSKFLCKNLYDNINKYHSSEDAKMVYNCFSSKLKVSDNGKLISKALLKDWVHFENDSLINVITGIKEKITTEKNKIRLICFTASWCTNCRKEIPLLKEIYTDLKDYSFQMVYVSTDKTEEQMSLFRKQIKEDSIPWRSLFSTPLKIEEKYQIRVYPTDMLVYPDNHIEYIDVRTKKDREKLYKLVKQNI